MNFLNNFTFFGPNEKQKKLAPSLPRAGLGPQPFAVGAGLGKKIFIFFTPYATESKPPTALLSGQGSVATQPSHQCFINNNLKDQKVIYFWGLALNLIDGLVKVYYSKPCLIHSLS
jgi:hypothetical protein